MTDKNGGVTSFTYDANGNMTSQTDPEKRKTVYSYDPADRLTGVTEGNTVSTRYSYDSVGNLTSKTDGAGKTTQYTYDMASRLTSIQNPLGEVQKLAYNTEGKLSAFTNPDGSRITYDYDKLDALVSKKTSDESDGTTLYGYDADGNRVSMKDVAGTTDYEYDAAGRITAVNRSDGTKILYAYDVYGNLSQLTYPDGTTVKYEYDALNRLTGITDRNGENTVYKYDASGNMTQVIRPNSTRTEIEYNAMGKAVRLTNYGMEDRCWYRRETVLSCYEYTYDLSGFITKEVQTQDGITTVKEYGYDSRGELTSVTETGRCLTIKTEYAYDAAGNRISVTENKGRYSSETTEYTYDDADRLTGASEKCRFGLLSQSKYEYDKNGNLIKEISRCAGVTEYSYDNENRLKAVKENGSLLMAALYDGDGNRLFTLNNRTSFNYVSNEGGTADSIYSRPWQPPFDWNLPWWFPWNWHFGGSIQIHFGGIFGWALDILNRWSFGGCGNWSGQRGRSGRQEDHSRRQYDCCMPDWDGEDSQSGTVSYDKQMIVDTMLVPNGVNGCNADEYELTGYINNVNNVSNTSLNDTQVLMEYGANGKITNTYEYGAQRSSLTNSSGTRYYSYDGRGSVSNLTGNRGQNVVSYSYDEYGNTTASRRYNNPYQYNAEAADSATGLQYLRARYYNPETGRFTAQDTLFGSLSVPMTQNLYAYTGNNPLNLTDPSGHGWFGDMWNNVSGRVSDALQTAGNAIKDACDWVNDNIIQPVCTVVNDYVVEPVKEFFSGSDDTEPYSYAEEEPEYEDSSYEEMSYDGDSGDSYEEESGEAESDEEESGDEEYEGYGSYDEYVEAQIQQAQAATEKKYCETPERIKKQILNGLGGIVVSILKDAIIDPIGDVAGLLGPAIGYNSLHSDYKAGEENLEHQIAEHLVSDPQAYYAGRVIGDAGGKAVGYAETAVGIATTAGGIVVTGASALATATGVGAPVGAAGFVVSGGAVAAGAAEIALGGSTVAYSSQNMQEDMNNYQKAASEAEKASDTVEWTNHGYKHFPQKDMSWKDIIESTKNGPAKYTPGTDVEALERMVWEKGTPVTNGKTWKVMEFDDVIGASNGAETKYMRVEMSSGTIHGHPITRAEYLKLIK